GGFVFEKLADFGDARDPPREVEVNAAKELTVVGQRRGLNVAFFPACFDELIDPRRQGFCGNPLARLRFRARETHNQNREPASASHIPALQYRLAGVPPYERSNG